MPKERAMPKAIDVVIKLDLSALDGAALARCAYAAYGEATGGQTHDGKPLPTWEELGETIQSAWGAAAGAVAIEAYQSAGSLIPSFGGGVRELNPDGSTKAGCAACRISGVCGCVNGGPQVTC